MLRNVHSIIDGILDSGSKRWQRAAIMNGNAIPIRVLNYDPTRKTGSWKSYKKDELTKTGFDMGWRTHLGVIIEVTFCGERCSRLAGLINPVLSLLFGAVNSYPHPRITFFCPHFRHELHSFVEDNFQLCLTYLFLIICLVRHLK